MEIYVRMVILIIVFVRFNGVNCQSVSVNDKVDTTFDVESASGFSKDSTETVGNHSSNNFEFISSDENKYQIPIFDEDKERGNVNRARREKEKEGESEESRRNRMKREADRTRQWRQRIRETENDEERKERLMKEALRVRERRKRVRDNENDDERRARLDRDRNRTRKWRDKVRAMETPEARRVRLDMETEKSRHRRAKKKSDTEESEMVTGLVTLAGNSVSDGISSSNYHQHSHINESNNPDIVLSYPGQSLSQAQAQNTYSTEPAHHQHQHDMPNIYTHSIQHQVIPTSQLLREAADHSSEVMTLITDSQQAYQTNI